MSKFVTVSDNMDVNPEHVDVVEQDGNDVVIWMSGGRNCVLRGKDRGDVVSLLNQAMVGDAVQE
jgi:hypothetical protein